MGEITDPKPTLQRRGYLKDPPPPKVFGWRFFRKESGSFALKNVWAASVQMSHVKT
jgi:hypothetical protein